ncbi:MAG: hypothetical protein MZV70_54470 [Desulfobacterales bacterium]|nr:hypothetical protein [Desulfobacterales bacterium]
MTRRFDFTENLDGTINWHPRVTRGAGAGRGLHLPPRTCLKLLRLSPARWPAPSSTWPKAASGPRGPSRLASTNLSSRTRKPRPRASSR